MYLYLTPVCVSSVSPFKEKEINDFEHLLYQIHGERGAESYL